MPNWCECELDIYGPREELYKFHDKARGENMEGDSEPLCFNNFIPMPEELRGTEAPPKRKNKELIKKYGADNWYDWSLIFWGTKWEVRDVQANTHNLFHVEIGKRNKLIRKLIYDFATAWSPPIPAVVAMGVMFPKLKFKLRYWEGGMAFQGELLIEKGKITKNITKSYGGGRGG